MSKLKSVSYDDTIIAMREALSAFTAIPLDNILNATSVRGPDLLKRLSDGSVTSPSLKDCYIVFELLENQDEDVQGATQSGSVIEIVQPYDFKMRVYGERCHEAARSITAMAMDESVVSSLRTKGIWIFDVVRPTGINEFVNRTVWPRCDLMISFETRKEIAKTDPGYAKILGTLTIEKTLA